METVRHHHTIREPLWGLWLYPVLYQLRFMMLMIVMLHLWDRDVLNNHPYDLVLKLLIGFVANLRLCSFRIVEILLVMIQMQALSHHSPLI